MKQPGERVRHAVMPDGSELVCYAYAGWRREWPDGRPSERLSVNTAARLAVTEDAEIFPGQPNGQAFMYRIRRGLKYR